MNMQKVAIIPNVLRDVELMETKRIISVIQGYGKTVFMEERFKNTSLDNVVFCKMDKLMSEAEIAIVLGGDGSILNIAPDAARYDLPILGINLGNLGFLAQAEKGDYNIFEVLFSGNYSVLSCMMLDCSIVKNNEEVDRFVGLNDVVVSGDGYSKMINVSASVNNTSIGRYSADGLIVATAVGSTAYSLSAGGAIMHPAMDAMMITPICPHTLKSRATVFPGEDVIEIFSSDNNRSSVVVMVDGRRRHILDKDEHLMISRSAYRTKLVNANNRNFFDVLREKLSD